MKKSNRGEYDQDVYGSNTQGAKFKSKSDMYKMILADRN